MISFWRIFWLELLSLTRSGTLWMLAAASVIWILAFPYVIRGDGTSSGTRELYIHFTLGGVFALLVIALLASATGTIARERTAKRLQLTMVRPVPYFAIALGKIGAHVLVGAVIMALACTMMGLSVDLRRPCNHVLSPILPSPKEEAKIMYEEYMKDPSTPAEVKRARKSVVMRLLTQRAVDHYQVIPTNSAVSWKFDGIAALAGNAAPSVRMRFTNQFDMRQDVIGDFRLGGMSGAVSNITQAVLEIPLSGPVTGAQEVAELMFENKGRAALMLRPRKDINVLVPADAFAWNLLRAFLGSVSVLALVIAVGVFLSAALGRPVAMFVAFVTLIVSEMSPSVIEQYPDALETDVADRIGLCITRCAAEVTRPLSSLSPLEALSRDECVEWGDVARLALADLALIPIVLSLLAAFALPRKQDD